MDDRRKNRDEEQNIQSELERQLEDFIGTMSDAAVGVGRTVADAVSDGFSEAEQSIKDAMRGSGFGERKASDGKSWFSGGQKEPTPADCIRASARKRYGTGLALMIIGGIFAVSFALGGFAVLASMPFAAEATGTAVAIGDMIVSDATATAGEFIADFGAATYSAMGITGGLLEAAAAGFVSMMWAGWKRIKASRWLKRCADTADSMDTSEGVSLGLLADNSSQKPRKILNTVRKYIRKGWLTAWLDEQAGKIYLTAADWRAAQEAKRAPQPEPEEQEKEPLNLETARRFAAVLEKERAVMKDEQAAEELERMQKTASAICDWLEAHPESLPKARRFAEYYIPTTLKLLHTYNDVQGQKGENAEAIRRDIAGILHTLNQAFDNLYDKLLSDMALDVSGEIAALQGMLASDGLTGEGML